MRSSLSIGANVNEAKNSSTRNEFKRYYEITLKSSNESKYWMCLLKDGFGFNEKELKDLITEADERQKFWQHLF